MFVAVMPDQSLGEFFLQRRLARGMTQGQLAARTGVDVKTVANLETGRTKTIRLGKRAAFAEALGMTVEEIQEKFSAEDDRGDGQSQSISFELPNEEYERLKAIAEREGVDVFEIIVRAINEKLAGADTLGKITPATQPLSKMDRLKLQTGMKTGDEIQKHEAEAADSREDDAKRRRKGK